jgi:hypothetical protein
VSKLQIKRGFRSIHNLFNISDSNVNLAIEDGRIVVASTPTLLLTTSTSTGTGASSANVDVDVVNLT